jgi:hypothetical protein
MIRIVSISFIAILFSTIFPSVWIVTVKVANGKETIIGPQPGPNTIRVNSFSYNGVLNVSNNNRTSADPQIDISGNNTYVVWSDDSPGNPDLFFTKSTDRGNSFSIKPINLSKNVGRSLYPDVAVSRSNNSYIVWSDDTPGNYEVLLLRNVR